jgi:23S rRNA (uracil-5-)-methyltransferase RumA
MRKNDIIKIKITDVTIDGSGVGRYEGMAVFVPCSTIGDELEVKIVKVKSNYSFGKIEKIISAGYERIKQDCTAYPKCGGCAFRHISYEAELKVKERHVKNCITRIGGLENIPIDGIIGAKNTEHYRNKMQLPVRKGKQGETCMGFYRTYSHDIVETDGCKLHPEIFEEIANDIKAWMLGNKIEPYNESNNSGIVRHIYIRQAEKTREILVCIVINSDDVEFKAELINRLTSRYRDIVGIILNINKSDTNVVLGEKEKVIYGRNYIKDILCEVKLNISYKSFYQVNHKQTEVLYETARKILKLTGKEKILELYCGIGAIGLFLARFAHFVVGVEIVQEAVEDAKLNAYINQLDNIKFICGDSNKKFIEALPQLNGIDIIVLDPPRKGCGRDLISKICETDANKVIYISCNPATLARDLKEFCKHGFKIENICPVDMFPRSAHVETVVLLCKTE